MVAGADCGLLVDPALGIDAVAAAIARLLADPTEARRLGQNGRRAFQTQTGKRWSRKLLGLYEAE